MQIYTSKTALQWGKLDLPLFGLNRDWFGNVIEEPSAFSLVKDPKSLWFISHFPHTTTTHPDAAPGRFTPELWKFDVAELFLANPKTGEYLEFNLASNSAWWASKFSSVRVSSPEQPDFSAYIRTHHDRTETQHHVAALEISIHFLEIEIDFSLGSTANIAFIRDTPKQRYLTASKLPLPEPDFHQPFHFPSISFTPLTQD